MQRRAIYRLYLVGSFSRYWIFSRVQRVSVKADLFFTYDAMYFEVCIWLAVQQRKLLGPGLGVVNPSALAAAILPCVFI